MPLRDFRCATCGFTEERFYHASAGPADLRCSTCDSPVEMCELSARYGKMQTFPFTTTHLTGDGKPITVEDIGHLRRLERQYGVVVHAYSQDPGNPDSARDLPRFRPGGRDYEGIDLPARVRAQSQERQARFLREVMRRG